MGKLNPQRGSGMYYVQKAIAPLHEYAVGQAVPEAFDWPNNQAMVRSGKLQFIPTALPEPPKMAVENPGLDATEAAGPSPAVVEASKSGADPSAKLPAKKHGRAAEAPK